MSVGLVIVSHSPKLAEGICDLASQMAADVVLAAAGGTDEGEIGTSLQRVTAAIAEADDGDGAVILTDLGSAVMTAETSLEFLDDDQRARVKLAHAPIVEGTIAAAVAAQTGHDVNGVADAAESAFTPVADEARSERQTPAVQGTGGQTGTAEKEPDGHEPDGHEPDVAHSEAGDGQGAVVGEFSLINPLGLHARPAAVLAQELSDLEAEITINGVDAKSVMLLMTLGAAEGHTLKVRATGPAADEAVELVRSHVDAGFGEI